MARRITVGLAMGAVMLGAMMGSAAPAVAAMAAITTVAPVGDDATEDRLKAAAASALGRAVRGAQAMGLDDGHAHEHPDGAGHRRGGGDPRDRRRVHAGRVGGPVGTGRPVGRAADLTLLVGFSATG